jgi:hypothetical protein
VFAPPARCHQAHAQEQMLDRANDMLCGKYVGKRPLGSFDQQAQERKKPRKHGAKCDGRYWARTSDLRLVDADSLTGVPLQMGTFLARRGAATAAGPQFCAKCVRRTTEAAF